MDLSQAAASPFFKAKQASTTMNYYTGQRGLEVVAAGNFSVKSLGRGLMTGTTKLSRATTVSLWEVSTKKVLGSVDVGPSSTVKDGYAWENLASPVDIKKGEKYRIVQKVVRNMPDKYTSAYMYGSSLANAFNVKFASINGLVSTSRTTGYPEDSYLNRGQGIGMVTFSVIENGGCGAGLWTCHSNHSCTKKELKGFLVESGPCTTDGNCVMSKNYGTGNYGNGERCTIKSPSAGTMKVSDYKIESHYDYLTVDGTAYRYSAPPTKTLTAPITLTWASDGSVTQKGFKVCVEPALLQEEGEGEGEDKEETEQEAASLIELTESELEQLSEEEKLHALAKQEQRRQEEADDIQAAEAAEKEAAEIEAEPEEEHEVEGSFLDADELALPDLTQDA